MKNIKIPVIILIIFLASSCADFLNVNHDPNNPEESTIQLVFPAGVENSAEVFGGRWMLLGEIWGQHWTSDFNAPQYQAEDKYNVPAGDYNYDLRGWEYLYTRALMDYEWVKQQSLEQENWNYYLMATTMQCFTYQVMADFFDQIPMSDALKARPAKFDTGEQVYDSLIIRLNDALSKDLTAATSTTPEGDDLIFNGSMDDWVAFANTLKLKIYLRQRFARPSVAENGIKAMYSSGASFLSTDAAFTDFAAETGRDNYMYALEFRGGNINMKASKTLLDFMVEKSEPRLDFIFKKSDNETKHYGAYQGDIRNTYSYPDMTTEPDLSSPLVTETMPTFFISKAESLFLQAEACLIYGLGGDEQLYKDAIDANFSYLDVKDGDGNNLTGESIYASSLYAEYKGETEAKFELIIFQKWLSFANTQGMEAFFEHNRTGYPRESAVNPGDDDFTDNYVEGEFTKAVLGNLEPPIVYPKRLMFPSSERSKNPENIPAAQAINRKVWWDVRTYPY